MRVKVMALIYSVKIGDLSWSSEKPRGKKGNKKTEFTAKASTVKSVLLAYADNANEDGLSSYPGYTTLERKTELSRQGIADTISALVQNDFMIPDGVSFRKTNQYKINMKKLYSIKSKQNKESSDLANEAEKEKEDESSDLTSKSQATLPPLVKPLDLNHPLTVRKPSSTPSGVSAPEKTSKNQEPDLLDGILHYAKIREEKEKEGKSWTHREKFPEPFLDNLDAYVFLTGQKPIKKNVSDWLMTAQDWHDLGVKPADIQKAYEKANPENGEGFTVARPGSLTNTAGMFAGKRKVEVEQSKPKIYTREKKNSVPNPMRR